MPRNKTGGNKAKKGKNQVEPMIKFTPLPEGELQHVCKVIKGTGNRRFRLSLLKDNRQNFTNFENSKDLFSKELDGSLRGSIRKGRRHWVSAGDYVMISFRDFNLKDNKVDIIHKYSDDQKRYLKRKISVEEVSSKSNQSDGNYIDFLDDDEEDKPVMVIKKKTSGYLDNSFLPSDDDDDDIEDETFEVSSPTEETTNHPSDEDIDVDEI